jgi:hypothetical protein
MVLLNIFSFVVAFFKKMTSLIQWGDLILNTEKEIRIFY